MIGNQVKHIIWDFNGTILDDLELSITVINKMLKERKLPTLTNETYKNIFGFPVKNYYEAVGFDFEKEDWQTVGMQFIEGYKSGFSSAKVFKDIESVLINLKAKGISASILSAMEHNHLLLAVKKLGIFNHFDSISGIDNHFASSKVDLGLELIKKVKFSKDQILLIGDTIHDYEVAKSLGVNCVLISSGHQSKERLLKTGVQVFETLSEMEANYLL